MKHSRPSVLAVALLAALQTPAPAATQYDEQTIEIAIEAGRLDAMMESAGRILHAHREREVDARAAYEPRRYIALSLQHAVARYNVLIPVACKQHFMTGGLCGRGFHPKWLREFSNADSDTVLHARVEEASVPIKALWTSLCHNQSIRKSRDACEIE